MRQFNRITKEEYFFYFIIFLNALPVLIFKFFPTLDGPAHLYNSNIISNLLFSKSQLNDFFILNSEPIPNWTGHLLLSAFNVFLPAFIAEKMLLLFYTIALPLSFWKLIGIISPDNKLFSYFIFPFIYSFTFYLGFYNFSIALIFMFLTIAFWINDGKSFLSFRNILKLFLLITLMYFSHIFVFALTVFLLFMHSLFENVINGIKDPGKVKNIVVVFIKKTGVLLIAASISLVLCLLYFYSRPATGNDTFLESKELIEWLKNIRPIIALNFSEEEVYTKPIFYLIVITLIIGVYAKINQINFNTSKSSLKRILFVCKDLLVISNFWLIATLIILFLYFKLPDSDGTAGYVSVRLGLLFFMFLILWLSTLKYAKWFVKFIIGSVLLLNFMLNMYYIKSTGRLNKVAIECSNASKFIEPNCVVIPLNYSDNWIHGHFSNYLGIEKPMIILENYECSTGYFPLLWNEKSIPNTLLGNISIDQQPCKLWKSNTLNAKVYADYIFLLGNIGPESDSCNIKIQQNIANYYRLVYETKNCKLFKKNQAVYK